MEKQHPSVEALWNTYIKTEEGKQYADATYEAWHFCADEKNANELAELVDKGIKTATCSLDYWYEEEGEPKPQVGDHSVIINWQGEAVCIIKTTSCSTIPFNEVTEEQACKEGEGDRSYDYWHRVHVDYFSKEMKEVNKDFSEDMKVLFEEFIKVFPK